MYFNINLEKIAHILFRSRKSFFDISHVAPMAAVI